MEQLDLKNTDLKSVYREVSDIKEIPNIADNYPLKVEFIDRHIKAAESIGGHLKELELSKEVGFDPNKITFFIDDLVADDKVDPILLPVPSGYRIHVKNLNDAVNLSISLHVDHVGEFPLGTKQIKKMNQSSDPQQIGDFRVESCSGQNKAIFYFTYNKRKYERRFSVICR